MNIFHLAADKQLQEYIKCHIVDLWHGTPFYGYRFMENAQKGIFGEMLVTKKMVELGSVVKPKLKGKKSDYDRIIDDVKTEIKFSVSGMDLKSMSIKKDSFMINHVSVSKSWERLIFMGVNHPSNGDSVCYWMNKKDFKESLALEGAWKAQQAGQSGGNDDYITSTVGLRKLVSEGVFKDISTW